MKKNISRPAKISSTNRLEDLLEETETELDTLEELPEGFEPLSHKNEDMHENP